MPTTATTAKQSAASASKAKANAKGKAKTKAKARAQTGGGGGKLIAGETPRSMFRMLTSELTPATPATYALATAATAAAANDNESTPASTPRGEEHGTPYSSIGGTPFSIATSTPGSAVGANISMLSVASTPGAGAAVGTSPGHFLAAAHAAKAARDIAQAEKAAKAAMPPPARPTSKRTPAAKKAVRCLPPEHTNALFASFATMGPSVEAKQAVQAGVEQLFKQLVGDLTVFAKHAGRITIEEDDVKLLMDRQRITMGQKGRSLHDLARQYLPLESVEQLIPVALASNEVTPAPKQTKKRASRKKTKKVDDADAANIKKGGNHTRKQPPSSGKKKKKVSARKK